MDNNKPILRIMTPARIIETPGGDYTEVVFLESAQFYRLEKRNTTFDEMLALLRKAAENSLTVEVELDSIESNIILGVKLNQ